MRRVEEYLSQRTAENKNEVGEELALLRSRVDLLKGKDKLIMKMYLDNGNSVQQIAELSGMKKATVAQKIRRIAKQLTDQRYEIIMQYSGELSRTQINIAREHFLLGITAKSIARRRGWSYYRGRKAVRKIRRFIKVKNQSEFEKFSEEKKWRLTA